MKFAQAIDHYWYAPVPAERVSLLRIAIGSYALVYSLVRYPALTSVTRFHAGEFEPVGPVALLEEPLSAALVHLPAVLSILSGAAFVLGFRYRIVGPLFAICFLWVTSYRSSWGMKFHTENLVALHLLLLAAAPAADTWSLEARRRTPPSEPHGRYGWAVRAICVVTVVSYVLAGIAKLRLAGADWVTGEVLRAQVAYDNLRKIELGSFHSPLGAFLVAYAWPFKVLAWLTMLLELGAPIALFGRRLARAWVAGAFAFHLGVVALMVIAFPYQLSFIAYLSFFEVERARGSRPFRYIQSLFERVASPPDTRSVARH
jgi:hypothetical protein